MKRKDILVAVLTLGMIGTLISVIGAGSALPGRVGAQCFMCEKLTFAQGVLEGITLEKFDLVSRNAARLRDMTQSNLWFTSRQPDYMRQTTNYQRSVEALYMAAVDHNLDAATAAYMKVTRECVECHRVVRAEQKVKAQEPKQ